MCVLILVRWRAPLELIKAGTPKRLNQQDGGEHRPKHPAIGDVQLATATRFLRVFVKRWLEHCRPEDNAANPSLVQGGRKGFGGDPRRPHELERPRRAASFGHVCPFEKNGSWINDRRVECRHVR